MNATTAVQAADNNNVNQVSNAVNPLEVTVNELTTTGTGSPLDDVAPNVRVIASGLLGKISEFFGEEELLKVWKESAFQDALFGSIGDLYAQIDDKMYTGALATVLAAFTRADASLDPSMAFELIITAYTNFSEGNNDEFFHRINGAKPVDAVKGLLLLAELKRAGAMLKASTRPQLTQFKKVYEGVEALPFSLWVEIVKAMAPFFTFSDWLPMWKEVSDLRIRASTSGLWTLYDVAVFRHMLRGLWKINEALMPSPVSAEMRTRANGFVLRCTRCFFRVYFESHPIYCIRMPTGIECRRRMQRIADPFDDRRAATLDFWLRPITDVMWRQTRSWECFAFTKMDNVTIGSILGARPLEESQISMYQMRFTPARKELTILLNDDSWMEHPQIEKLVIAAVTNDIQYIVYSAANYETTHKAIILLWQIRRLVTHFKRVLGGHLPQRQLSAFVTKFGYYPSATMKALSEMACGTAPVTRADVSWEGSETLLPVGTTMAEVHWNTFKVFLAEYRRVASPLSFLDELWAENVADDVDYKTPGIPTVWPEMRKIGARKCLRSLRDRRIDAFGWAVTHLPTIKPSTEKNEKIPEWSDLALRCPQLNSNGVHISLTDTGDYSTETDTGRARAILPPTEPQGLLRRARRSLSSVRRGSVDARADGVLPPRLPKRSSTNNPVTDPFVIGSPILQGNGAPGGPINERGIVTENGHGGARSRRAAVSGTVKRFFHRRAISDANRFCSEALSGMSPEVTDDAVDNVNKTCSDSESDYSSKGSDNGDDLGPRKLQVRMDTRVVMGLKPYNEDELLQGYRIMEDGYITVRRRLGLSQAQIDTWTTNDGAIMRNAVARKMARVDRAEGIARAYLEKFVDQLRCRVAMNYCGGRDSEVEAMLVILRILNSRVIPPVYQISSGPDMPAQESMRVVGHVYPSPAPGNPAEAPSPQRPARRNIAEARMRAYIAHVMGETDDAGARQGRGGPTDTEQFFPFDPSAYDIPRPVFGEFNGPDGDFGPVVAGTVPARDGPVAGTAIPANGLVLPVIFANLRYRTHNNEQIREEQEIRYVRNVNVNVNAEMEPIVPTAAGDSGEVDDDDDQNDDQTESDFADPAATPVAAPVAAPLATPLATPVANVSRRVRPRAPSASAALASYGGSAPVVDSRLVTSEASSEASDNYSTLVNPSDRIGR